MGLPTGLVHDEHSGLMFGPSSFEFRAPRWGSQISIWGLVLKIANPNSGFRAFGTESEAEVDEFRGQPQHRWSGNPVLRARSLKLEGSNIVSLEMSGPTEFTGWLHPNARCAMLGIAPLRQFFVAVLFFCTLFICSPLYNKFKQTMCWSVKLTCCPCSVC